MRRRILVLAGSPRSLVNFRGPMLASMVNAGHEVLAGAPNVDPRTISDLKALGVRSVDVRLDRTGTNPLGDLGTILGLRKVFLREKPDIYLGCTMKPVLLGSIAARWARVEGIHSMVTGLGYAFLGENWKQRLVGSLVTPMLRFALPFNRTVFFQNPDDLEMFARLGLVDASAQGVLINGSGVDLTHFSAFPTPLGPPSFLLVARLYREKGIGEFVEASRQLKERHPSARFILVGAPDSNPSALSVPEIESWVSKGWVEWRGAVDDVRPHLREAAVFVLPSYREGTPRSVLEAMATGRACVTTDAPGCRETIVHGESGLLVSPKAVEPLRNAMEQFILQPELIGLYGRAARRRAEEKFDVHAVNHVILRRLGLVP